MWIINSKAWLRNVGYEAVLSSGFDLKLPSHKGKVLDLAKSNNQLGSEALGADYKATNSLMFGV